MMSALTTTRKQQKNNTKMRHTALHHIALLTAKERTVQARRLVMLIA
jgi:hypothetical protein